VCAAGGRAAVIRSGDIVWTAPGELHWHGGGPVTTLLHLAVSLGQTTWAQEVTDAEYGPQETTT
jgi:quercetin dioxygenase-like cupin family protein